MTVPIDQGLLNRLRASVVYAAFPELGIIANNLTKSGIVVSFEGDAAQKIGTMTGAVDSPEPYVMINVEIHMLRTQALAAAYKQQIETNTSLGSINVISDTNTLPDYQIEGVVLLGVSGLTYDGNNPDFSVRLKGIYNVNAELWAST